MNFNFGHFFRLTAGVVFAAGLSAQAAEGPAPIPVAVAESELFEVVGRMEDDGFVFYIDRADSNAPVLAATLEVESEGKPAKAVFRAERGDYLIADADWLKPLRQPGTYPLAFTVIAGDESDLLASDFMVTAPSADAATGAGLGRAGWWLVLPGLLAVVLIWRRARKGGKA
ncbi:MAG: putative ATPase superfamily [Proteobacteria bacterium]|nr:putative ATPase superfamily [Pseudomonadota bacterium]